MTYRAISLVLIARHRHVTMAAQMIHEKNLAPLVNAGFLAVFSKFPTYLSDLYSFPPFHEQ